MRLAYKAGYYFRQESCLMLISTPLKDCPSCGAKLNLQVYQGPLGQPIGNLYCINKCGIHHDFRDNDELEALLRQYGVGTPRGSV